MRDSMVKGAKFRNAAPVQAGQTVDDGVDGLLSVLEEVSPVSAHDCLYILSCGEIERE